MRSQTSTLPAVCSEPEHAKTSTQTQQVPLPARDSILYPQPAELTWPDRSLPRYPDDISPTVLLEFEERWLRDREPADEVEHQLKIMLVCGIYRSHDPLILQWRTGLPKTFVDAVLTVLTADPGWLAPGGYQRLVADLRRFKLDDDRVDRTLGEILLDLAAATVVPHEVSMATVREARA